MTPEQRNELLLRVSHCEIAFYTESTDWRCAGYGEPDKCRDSLVEYVDSIIGGHAQREAELTAEIAKLRDELQLKCNPAEIATQAPDGWKSNLLNAVAVWLDANGHADRANELRTMFAADPQPTTKESLPVDHLAVTLADERIVQIIEEVTGTVFALQDEHARRDYHPMDTNEMLGVARAIERAAISAKGGA